MYPQDEITAKKRAFAAARLIYPDYMDAGLAAGLMESRPHYATWVAEQWRLDPEVLQYIAELRAEGGVAAVLPTKEAFAFTLWNTACECTQKELKLKYLELLGKTLNFIEKPVAAPPANLNVTNNDNRRVMLMPQPLNLDDWERAASKQQDKLLIEATPVAPVAAKL